MTYSSLEKTHAPSRLALIVGKAATICSLLYHLGVLFIFFFMKIYPLAYYNIFSCIFFLTILLLIPHRKSLVVLYLISMIEVIFHQSLANYLLGSAANFDFFIFAMGLLAFLIFDYQIKISIPFTLISSAVFIYHQNQQFPGFYQISPMGIKFFHNLNLVGTIIMIVITILLFTSVVAKVEKNLTTQNGMLESEIKRASVIQQAFFRHDINGLIGWDVANYIKPMAGVSGDFFDFYKSNKNLDGFGIFDVSGHGISSGLITMLVKNIIHQEFYKNKEYELWEILNKINDRIVEEKGDVENYLTGILVRYTPKQAEMVIAGHPTPIIYKHATGTSSFLKKTTDSSGAIGIAGFPTFYVSQYVDFEAGDRMLFFSDGVTDAVNDRKESFGRERLLNAFNESVDLEADMQIEYIKRAISDFRASAAQNDDISLICIARTGK